MDTKSSIETEQHKKALSQADDNAIIQIINDALSKIREKPKQRYSKQEIEEARGELVLMNDRVFLVTFSDNKNNPIITGKVNALRKIHNMDSIPPIERTTVQNVSIFDVLERGMIGDLYGEGSLINITVEVQKKSQAGYAVRSVLTPSNVMRSQFKIGSDFTEAPDVISINILGFKLPELENRKMFCSRIVRAEFETKETFLAEKYSDYFIELPKMDDFTKDKLPEEYHDIWDICCIFRAKIKEHEEVIRMQSITNPVALDLANEVKKAVASDDFVSETLSRKDEFEQIRDYIFRQHQKSKAEGMEKMIISAIKNGVAPEVITTLSEEAGITEARLAEIKKQVQ